MLSVDIARHVRLAEAAFEQKLTSSLPRNVLDHNNIIPQGQERKYADITKGEWNLLRAQRMQNKVTYSLSKTFENLIKEKKIANPSMCTRDTFIITDSGIVFCKQND